MRLRCALELTGWPPRGLEQTGRICVYAVSLGLEGHVRYRSRGLALWTAPHHSQMNHTVHWHWYPGGWRRRNASRAGVRYAHARAYARYSKHYEGRCNTKKFAARWEVSPCHEWVFISVLYCVWGLRERRRSPDMAGSLLRFDTCQWVGVRWIRNTSCG